MMSSILFMFWAEKERERENMQLMLCSLLTVFLTSARESRETEGGRGASQEQTTCLQGAKEYVYLTSNLGNTS